MNQSITIIDMKDMFSHGYTMLWFMFSRFTNNFPCEILHGYTCMSSNDYECLQFFVMSNLYFFRHYKCSILKNNWINSFPLPSLLSLHNFPILTILSFLIFIFLFNTNDPHICLSFSLNYVHSLCYLPYACFLVISLIECVHWQIVQVSLWKPYP